MSEMNLLSELIGMGIVGLDDILIGGLPPFRQSLIEGKPGTGKTTLGMQFLLEGRPRLVATEHPATHAERLVSSSIPDTVRDNWHGGVHRAG